jgi:hypothetical protein
MNQCGQQHVHLVRQWHIIMLLLCLQDSDVSVVVSFGDVNLEVLVPFCVVLRSVD